MVTPVPSARRSSDSLLAIMLAVTIFVSAFLLFQVQPLISKLILPWFGGSPAVWTTAMLFFQCVLFCGYAYAHLVAHWLTLKQQTLLHVTILAVAACLAYSVMPGERLKPHGDEDPTLRILLLLASCVGLPYFCLATTGPLIQSWFTHVFPGQSPYRLYSLSNVGSFLALLSFPYLFEPQFELPELGWLWTLAFWVFAVSCGVAAVQVLRRSAAFTPSLGTHATSDASGGTQSVSLVQRASWLVLPALASLMFIATTDHVSHDVAPEPRLWISTLSLYLLTFIICFEHERWYRRGWTAAACLVGIALLSGHEQLLTWMGLDWEFGLTGTRWSHFVVMFLVCLMCHGELVRLRPASSRRLTEFYLCISLGGACGGLFVSLVATNLFRDYYEWTLCLLASLAVATLVLIAVSSPRAAESTRRSWPGAVLVGAVGGLLACFVAYWEDPFDWREFSDHEYEMTRLVADRNFYGSVTVDERRFRNQPERDHRIFYSGIVLHGMQFLQENKRLLPTAYYALDSGVGETMEYAKSRQASLRVAVVGLGVGTVAIYAREQDAYDFYEINPAVVRIAREQFWFLPHCRARSQRVIIGDARLKLDELPPDVLYDIILLDAFSGDSIPIHLLTREAFASYKRHLKPRGYIAVNITNSYLNLYPQVRRQAEYLGMGFRNKDVDGELSRLVYHNHYVIITDDQEYLAKFPSVNPKRFAENGDVIGEDDPNLDGVPLWTDHFSSINSIQLSR